MLAEARAAGLSDRLRAGVRADLRLLGELTDVVVCTCPTVGAAAEEAAEELAPSVVRIDRPMAEAAARHGGAVAVVAAEDSALGPAVALLLECGVEEVESARCFEARRLLEAGDEDGGRARLAERVRELAPEFDVVVLAEVEASVAGVGATVLSSPRPAVEAA